MKLAFVLFKYFPYGGLQKDFLQVLQKAYERGHDITTYAIEWQGEKPTWANVEIISTGKKLRNHARYKQFICHVQQLIKKNNFDQIIGFNKMPGLDIYFAGDPCFYTKAFERRPWWYRYTSRFNFFYKAERAVFQVQAKTKILVLSEKSQREFMSVYQSEASRFEVLPPGIDKSFIRAPDANNSRINTRKQLNISEDAKIILSVGSGFATKGLDRTIKAIATLPSTIKNNLLVLVVGLDKPDKYISLCKRLQVISYFKFLGGRDDVKELMLAADLLCHPAKAEAGGKVLIEALLSGLPVITSDVCGYLDSIKDNPGVNIIPSPFNETDYANTINTRLTAQNHHAKLISETMALQKQIFTQADKVLDVIEHEARYVGH